MLKTRQNINKLSTNYTIPKTKKEEIISEIQEKIKETLNDLSSNFSQQTVKEELDKIKENYISKLNPEDYIIKPGEIEYKSTYPKIFNDEIKYGILANIRDSTNERMDKFEDIVEKMYKRIDYIKDNLKINDKSLYSIKQKKLYEKMISYNSSFNNTIPTMSNTTLSNNNEENNLKVIVDGNISFKKDDNTIENNINEVKNLNVSKGSLGTSCCSEKKKITVKLNIESENEGNDAHFKNLNSESSILSTDRKSKGSFIHVNNSKK